MIPAARIDEASHPMLIINSDNFGRSESVNRAIIKSFEAGLCSSTTLMATMPGFEEACSLAHDHGLRKQIGLHIVLRDGSPLTDGLKKFPRFCDRDGRLAPESSPPVFALDASERRALAEEIRAQIARCRTNGIPLSHLDSHYHLHNLWPILGVVIAVAHSEHVPYVRLARNWGPGSTLRKRAYKAAVNRKLRRACLSRTKYFGTIEDFIFRKEKRGSIEERSSFEVMIHPVFHGKGFVVDAGEDEPLENRIKDVETFREAVSFSGAKYLRGVSAM